MALSLISGGDAFGGAGGTSDYKDFAKKYDQFASPLAAVLIKGKPLAVEEDPQLAISEISVEVTSGYEASVASFRIFNAYDNSKGAFRYEELKEQLFLGASAEIKLGYRGALETVFVGFVAGVAFGFEEGDLPYIEVTAMDIKSLMMGGTYSCQLTAHSYGAAVREIFQRAAYKTLKSSGGFLSTDYIDDTPDKKEDDAREQDKAPLTQTIEMVAESDYEFVVKAAKKFNYEFFVDRGKVYFRPAKNNKTPQAKLGVSRGILSFRAEYSITGLSGSIEARSVNPGKGELITSSDNVETTLSTNSKAQSLVGKAAKIYIDPTIASKAQADARVASLKEKMTYRLGSFEAECIGLPSLSPGRFLDATGMGAPADNSFYITSVRHEFNTERGYRTLLRGCAADVKPDGMGNSTADGAGGFGF